jgi:hypothetical protein
MTRTFYDAIDALNLPDGGDGYLGYDDGNWPDVAAIQERFPGKVVGSITTDPKDNKGSIGDGPPDNGSWLEWIAWVQMRRDAGQAWVTINTGQAMWSTGASAFRAAGVSEPLWWIADYDGIAALASGQVAKQYASNAKFDTSVVADYWPGVDPVPVPVPVPIKEEDDVSATPDCYDVPVSATSAEREIWALYSNGYYVHVPDPQTYGGLQALGAKTAVVSWAFHQDLVTKFG